MKKILHLLLLIVMPLAFFGQIKISGNVKDSDSKEPLLGVYVVIKDSQTGTVTDLDGNYTISVPDAKSILVFSYVGYQTQEIRVDNRNMIDVVMIQGKVLEDVVVIGYGTVKREDVTGTLQSVSSEKFNRGAITGGTGTDSR